MAQASPTLTAYKKHLLTEMKIRCSIWLDRAKTLRGEVFYLLYGIPEASAISRQQDFKTSFYGLFRASCVDLSHQTRCPQLVVPSFGPRGTGFGAYSIHES
ncbi:uncharacterized protein PHALS_02571 [Plasmopara halstedii]|uniref:Uncharacterized protein n=1 Tax=Plasmopara halstedii TaxID=4781 RepID=A0A0P1AY51_PLAHL|nr:uncharacterized protein PHALS_02571 [Plasmopara halstedii]CEG46152.1 hypothetical protein PHALS_02571 [Plasmopara halstedii]|eukprot:XP_024582521.1 hypothetical protein PHALS_02571 [Plasmopara halstedii]